MRGLLSVVGALSALQLVSVVAQDIPACVSSCAAQVRADFTKFACTSAEDRACLCPKQDFHSGIRDCAQPTCNGNEDNVKAFLAGDFCAGFSPPAGATSASAPAAPESSAPSSSEPQAPSSTSAAAETTSEAPATTSQAPSTTSQVAEETSAPESTSSTEQSTAPPSTTEPATTEAQSTSTSSSSASSSTSTSAPSDSDAGSTKDENDKQDKEDETETASGLSAAAKAGIAVGVIAAAIAGAVVAWCVLRKRKQHPSRPVEISKPISGSRGGYGQSDDGQYEKYGDIEMTTRYEDMLPRQQPRTMV